MLVRLNIYDPPATLQCFFKWPWPEVSSWLPRQRRWASGWLPQKGWSNASVQGTSWPGRPPLALSCPGNDGCIKAERAVSCSPYSGLHWQDFAPQPCFGFSSLLSEFFPLPFPPSSALLSPCLLQSLVLKDDKKLLESTPAPAWRSAPGGPRWFYKCSNYPEWSWGPGAWEAVDWPPLPRHVRSLSGWKPLLWSPCKVTG